VVAKTAELLRTLSPIAEQASRILLYLADLPQAFSGDDSQLAAHVGMVSAQQVAVVRRALVGGGFAERVGFSFELRLDRVDLSRLAANLEGIATYLVGHQDRDVVRLVLTEPGEMSALRLEIGRQHALAPLLFHTVDAFINLARSAEREFVVLVPFIDDEGAELLVHLFSICKDTVTRSLICRPLNEAHCGPAFERRRAEFRQLKVSVFEYALPSSLPSGRETFHAKVILADDSAFYVGSSNLMGSALERSLECGVIVHGQCARQLSSVLDAIRGVAIPVDTL